MTEKTIFTEELKQKIESLENRMEALELQEKTPPSITGNPNTDLVTVQHIGGITQGIFRMMEYATASAIAVAKTTSDPEAIKHAFKKGVSDRMSDEIKEGSEELSKGGNRCQS